MMASLRSGSRSVTIALLITYGIALPLLLVQPAFSHKYIENRRWIHSVHQGRLDYFHRGPYGYEVNQARDNWRAYGPIRIRKISDRSQAHLRVVDQNDCAGDWIGAYTTSTTFDRVIFNRCVMDWDGGFFEPLGRYLGPTTASRRVRAAVHEFGHAQGLDHNLLGACGSILHDLVDYDASTCYVPTAHDRDDINRYWP
jgi:hypothetical protein